MGTSKQLPTVHKKKKTIGIKCHSAGKQEILAERGEELLWVCRKGRQK